MLNVRKRNTVTTTMWRQSQTNNYRPSFVAGSHSKESSSEQSTRRFIFFDMEKAYDLTWGHSILMDINEAGIEGRMFKFIENFLKPSSFKVKAN